LRREFGEYDGIEGDDASSEARFYEKA